MASGSDVQKKQAQDKAVVLRGILSSCVLLFLFGVIAFYFPFSKPHLPSLLDRITFTLLWLMLFSLSVVAGIAYIASVRLFTPAINALDKEAEKYVAISLRYLQNTFEQFCLHLVALLVLSTHLSANSMHLIPLLVGLFLIGRVLFAFGYSKQYQLYRATGFALTFYSTLIVYGYCLYCSFAYGFVPH